MSKKYRNVHVIIVLLFITIYYSCSPEDEFHNPADYLKYITISYDQYPSISPDGEWLVYFHKCLEYPEPEEYQTGLYLTRTNSFNPILLLGGEHYHPDWSPDGNWIVFSSEGTLQMINFEGDSILTFSKLVGIPLFFPDWSGNSEYILFSSPFVNGGGGFLCSSTFDNYRQIYDHYQLNAYPVKWFEDNKILGCEFSNEWSGEEIFIIDTTLTNYRRLTYNNTSDRDPSYSTTSKYIAWSRNLRIIIMNPDENVEKEIDYGQYPKWIPNSNSVVYSSYNQDYSKEVIWKIDLDSNNKTQLTY